MTVILGMTGIDLDAMPATRVYTTYEVRSLCFRWYLRGARDWRASHPPDERARDLADENARLKAERDDARATLRSANRLAEEQAAELCHLRQTGAAGRQGAEGGDHAALVRLRAAHAHLTEMVGQLERERAAMRLRQQQEGGRMLTETETGRTAMEETQQMDALKRMEPALDTGEVAHRLYRIARVAHLSPWFLLAELASLRFREHLTGSPLGVVHLLDQWERRFQVPKGGG